MKTIHYTLLSLLVLILGGCKTGKLSPVQTTETAIISCEAAHVTILMTVQVDEEIIKTIE